MNIKEETLSFCITAMILHQRRYENYIKYDSFPYEDKEHCIKKLQLYKDMRKYLEENLK